MACRRYKYISVIAVLTYTRESEKLRINFKAERANTCAYTTYTPGRGDNEHNAILYFRKHASPRKRAVARTRE